MTAGHVAKQPQTLMNLVVFASSLIFSAMTTYAQMTVAVSPVKVIGQKAVVPLTMENHFAEKVESARAVCFLTDEQDKVVGQPTTRWVIGGSNTNGLAPGATNNFYFVVTSDTPFTTTNLTANVQFSRVVLQDGKLADVAREVQVTTAENH